MHTGARLSAGKILRRSFGAMREILRDYTLDSTLLYKAMRGRNSPNCMVTYRVVQKCTASYFMSNIIVGLYPVESFGFLRESDLSKKLLLLEVIRDDNAANNGEISKMFWSVDTYCCGWSLNYSTIT